MPTAKVRWVEGMQFVGMDSGGHSVVLSGDDQQAGVRPSEMLLVALAACTAVDVVEIMAKKRKPLRALEIVITGDRDPDPPWPYRRIQVSYRLAGDGLTEKAVSQAIALSSEKYCSVAATVRGVASIETTFEITP
ncbi:MAG: OsmC family protein [Desulfobacterales bacterium]|nr:OsmC family protein [Desulfobacterales bacterium]MDJ0855095.1 OsmC family protein [Desulfobacterales bacterium]MDJ0887198.1 OsmC family protein [Desulfobacterales bacterium]MDJ0988704.1 OsmC family protein [Desulfobacterales bacterium]